MSWAVAERREAAESKYTRRWRQSNIYVDINAEAPKHYFRPILGSPWESPGSDVVGPSNVGPGALVLMLWDPVL